VFGVGIVVQCSGSANKNIGDAFLLTWKLDPKLDSDEVAVLADQALLAFCKTLVELIRHEDFICNFSVAATARLYKRFPEYGNSLNVGTNIRSLFLLRRCSHRMWSSRWLGD
jgi:hypothetical protein